jgi:hypothetical protein
VPESGSGSGQSQGQELVQGQVSSVRASQGSGPVRVRSGSVQGQECKGQSQGQDQCKGQSQGQCQS